MRRFLKVAFFIALAAAALATLVGGLYHTFHGELLWKATALAAGLFSFFLGLSVALVFLSPGAARIARIILIAQLCIYAIAALFIDDFWLVIVDYGSVMLAILVVCAIRWSNAAARWIAAAILISVAASALPHRPRGGPAMASFGSRSSRSLAMPWITCAPVQSVMRSIQMTSPPVDKPPR